MKKVLVIFISLIFLSCGLSEDCIKSAGAIKNQIIDVTPFENIYVYAGIELVVTQGPNYEVSVQAGANFIDDIDISVKDNSLFLKDNSGCNWVRDYGKTIVYVTAPNIVEIYSNTDQKISSNGVLTYPMLRLYSMDFFGGVGAGDFIMEVDNSQLVVQSNHVSSFFITGRTTQLLLNFYNGNGRFEGENFHPDEIVLFHRGANDLIINPVSILRGDIYGTGNVRCKSHPATVEVTKHYSGRLIFD